MFNKQILTLPWGHEDSDPIKDIETHKQMITMADTMRVDFIASQAQERAGMKASHGNIYPSTDSIMGLHDIAYRKVLEASIAQTLRGMHSEKNPKIQERSGTGKVCFDPKKFQNKKQRFI